MLPELQHLSLALVGAMSRGLGWKALTLEPQSVSLTKLEFARCYLNPKTLTTILSACRRLKVLRLSISKAPTYYEHHLIETAWADRLDFDDLGRWTDMVGESGPRPLGMYFTAKEMQDALDHSAPTLEELALVYNQADGEHRLDLRLFKKLRTLLAQRRPIATLDLPASLEDLTIIDFSERRDFARNPVFDIKSIASFPKLPHLTLIGNHYGHSGDCPMHELMDLFIDSAPTVSYMHPRPGGAWKQLDCHYSISWRQNGYKVKLIDQSHQYCQ